MKSIWHCTNISNLFGSCLISLCFWVTKFDAFTSFENIHMLCNRATPNQIMKYKLALCLYKLYNIDFNSLEFVLLNFNQVITSRQLTFTTLKSNRTKVGLNSLANRFHHINGNIPFEWLNCSFETYILKCKRMYL